MGEVSAGLRQGYANYFDKPETEKPSSGNSSMAALIDIRGVQGQGIPTNNMGAANAIRAVGHAVVSTHSGVLAGTLSKKTGAVCVDFLRCLD